MDHGSVHHRALFFVHDAGLGATLPGPSWRGVILTGGLGDENDVSRLREAPSWLDARRAREAGLKLEPRRRMEACDATGKCFID